MTSSKWNKEEQEKEMKLRHDYRRRRKEALEALEKELEKDDTRAYEDLSTGHGGDDV